jgi:hypothetical protein
MSIAGLSMFVRKNTIFESALREPSFMRIIVAYMRNIDAISADIHDRIGSSVKVED